MQLQDRDLQYAFLILRIALGLTFCIAGLSKLLNYSGSVTWIAGSFTQTWLPAFLVNIFAHVLPFFEFGLGSLIILGLFTRFALYLVALLMLTLNFGLLVKGDDGAARNIPYVLLIGLDIMLLNYNKYSLDRLLSGKRK